MQKPWFVEAELSAEAAARLIERQVPALAPASLQPLGAGWDNLAFLVNGAYAFRFPRRAMAAELMRAELRVLPYLAPRLPIAVTAPRFIGVPDDEFPYYFSGYPLIAGVTACRAALTEEDRCEIAAPIAEFLAALHGIEVPANALDWATQDTLGRADIARRAPIAKQRLLGLGLSDDYDVPAIERWFDSLAATKPWTGPLRWLHGDLYARHLLLDGEKRLCGVIDWGDVHLGDPALDLSIAFSFLPPQARDVFRPAYGSIDDDTWNRARFRALHYGVILTEYGRDIGDAAICAAADFALRNASR